jgi:hypothetical protein
LASNLDSNKKVKSLDSRERNRFDYIKETEAAEFIEDAGGEGSGNPRCNR